MGIVEKLVAIFFKFRNRYFSLHIAIDNVAIVFILFLQVVVNFIINDEKVTKQLDGNIESQKETPIFSVIKY